MLRRDLSAGPMGGKRGKKKKKRKKKQETQAITVSVHVLLFIPGHRFDSGEKKKKKKRGGRRERVERPSSGERITTTYTSIPLYRLGEEGKRRGEKKKKGREKKGRRKKRARRVSDHFCKHAWLIREKEKESASFPSYVLFSLWGGERGKGKGREPLDDILPKDPPIYQVQPVFG